MIKCAFVYTNISGELMELTKNAVLKNVHINDLQEILARDDIRIYAGELLDVTTDFSAKNKQRLLEIIRNRGKNRIFCWMNGFLNQLILIKHMHLPTTIWWHNVY